MCSRAFQEKRVKFLIYLFIFFIFCSLLSTSLDYYSTSLPAQAGPNYTSHFVKVPSCSICSMQLLPGTNMHAHTHQVQHFRQTDKGRSRYTFPSGYAFVYKNSWTFKPPIKCGDKRDTVIWSGQMTVDMNTESRTPVQALDTASAPTQERPLTFCLHIIKAQGFSWQNLCMYAWACMRGSGRVNTQCSGTEALWQ